MSPIDILERKRLSRLFCRYFKDLEFQDKSVTKDFYTGMRATLHAGIISKYRARAGILTMWISALHLRDQLRTSFLEDGPVLPRYIPLLFSPFSLGNGLSCSSLTCNSLALAVLPIAIPKNFLPMPPGEQFKVIDLASSFSRAGKAPDRRS